jgi:predicted O-methyltransferase YrrM
MSSDNPVPQSNDIVDKTRRLAARGLRLAQLVAARGGAMAADALRRKARELEIRLDGLHKGLDVKPISDIAFPRMDLAASRNPVAEIMAAPEFDATKAYFYDNPVAKRSLISSQSQALLYSLIRNLRPDHVFEIGTYKAGTTEAICRAMHANGKGIAHAVDPFRGEYIAAVLKLWPPELFRHVQLHAKDSMAFFGDMERHNIHPALVFVDGNHDYEFAAFDIACGARAITPGGYIVVDNVAQPGPFFAARDFLAVNPDWSELGSAAIDYDRDKAFDQRRSTIVDTDFMVLRAPITRGVGDRPLNPGRIRWNSHKVVGLRLQLVPPSQPGRLTVQVVLRGFGAVPAETTGAASVQVEAGSKELSITLTQPAQVTGQFVYFTVEPWLIWHGAQPLQLLGAPEPF